MTKFVKKSGKAVQGEISSKDALSDCEGHTSLPECKEPRRLGIESFGFNRQKVQFCFAVNCLRYPLK